MEGFLLDEGAPHRMVVAVLGGGPRGVERLHAIREAHQVVGTQRELGGVAADRLALALQLGGAQRQHGLRHARHRAVMVDHELVLVDRGRRRPQPLPREPEHHRERAVVGMEVLERRPHQPRRPEAVDLLGQHLDQIVVARQQRARDPLVGEPEELDVTLADAETGQRGQRLEPAPGAPALAILRADPPAALGGALRPGVVLAVGDEQHAQGGARGDRPLQQAGGRQGFVVGVGGDQQDAILASQIERSGHRLSKFRGGGIYPFSTARAHTTVQSRSPAAGTYRCRPPANQRGPSSGAPSSRPRPRVAPASSS